MRTLRPKVWISLSTTSADIQTFGLRVDEDTETEGLDITEHDERGYIL